MRAPTVSCDALDKVIPGAIAMLSSSLKASGRSFTCARWTASGMRLPLAARAKTKTESPGDACAASAGSSVTVPLTLVPAAGFAALAAGRAAATCGDDEAAGAASLPASLPRASAIIACTRGASSLSGGSWTAIFCHCAIATA